jgi:hypothetical protein
MGFFSDSVRNPVNPVHPVQYSCPGLAGEREGCLPSFPCPKRQMFPANHTPIPARLLFHHRHLLFLRHVTLDAGVFEQEKTEETENGKRESLFVPHRLSC